jgi:hypothetical protein
MSTQRKGHFITQTYEPDTYCQDVALAVLLATIAEPQATGAMIFETPVDVLARQQDAVLRAWRIADLMDAERQKREESK